MILGIYYLSQPPYQDKKIEGYFVNNSEIEHALETGQIKVHSRVISRFITLDENGSNKLEKHISTAGRFLLANLLPKNINIKFSLIDRLLPKKIVSEIIDRVFRFCGQKSTVIYCDKLKDLGFKHAFKAGISFGKDDLVIPENKQQLIEETKKLISDYENQYTEGLITRGEKYNKVVDAW
jgi:DNA-directed RNA polymerase subunit beta'